MREVCYCGRVGELENREILLDGGDGSPAHSGVRAKPADPWTA